MTLEEINYIAQTVAVFLVLGSLIAIYDQQRRDKLAAQAERNRNAGLAFQNWYDRLRDDPEYSRIIRVSAHHWPEMPDNPKFVAHMFWTSVLLVAASAEREARLGLAKTPFHDEQLESLLGALSMPGLKAWWTENKAWMPPEFRVLVDARLAGAGARLIPWHEIMPLWKADNRDLEILIADETARLVSGKVGDSKPGDGATANG